MTKLVPGANDFAMLQSLQWNTRYEVEITARNVKGLSEPTFYQFFMPQKPDVTGKNVIEENTRDLLESAAQHKNESNLMGCIYSTIVVDSDSIH